MKSIFEKQLSVKKLSLRDERDANAIIDIVLHNHTDDFDIDFSVVATTSGGVNPSVFYEAVESDDCEDNLDNIAFTPYSQKGLDAIEAIDDIELKPPSINQTGYLYRDYDAEGGVRRLFDIMEGHIFINDATSVMMSEIRAYILSRTTNRNGENNE